MAGTGRDRAVLVTGALGNLGRALVDRLGTAGWHVVAADLDGDELDALDGPGTTPVALDVTDPEAVERAVATVQATTSALAGVVHAAAVIDVGPLVELPDATFERMLAVNVTGVYRVTRAVLPLLLAGRGRVVTVSSDTGNRPPAPFNGAYSLTKHALEAYTHGLRRELALLDVPVVMVRPGPFGTGGRLGARYRVAAERSEHYTETLRRLAGSGRIDAPEGQRTRPADDDARTAAVTERVEAALATPRPRAVYTVGTRRDRALLEALPRPLADAVYRRRYTA